MMSLVSTPVVAARVTAKKHAVRKTTIASATNTPESSSVAQKAVAATIALSFIAQPAFADDAADKKAKAAALAAEMAGDLQAKKGVVMDSSPKKVKQLAAPSLDQCSSGDMMLKVASELGEFKARKSTTGLKWELNDSEGEPILKTKLFYRSRAQLDVLEDLHGPDRPTDRQTKRRRVGDGAKVVIDLT